MSRSPPFLRKPCSFIRLVVPAIFASFLCVTLAARLVVNSDFALPTCGMRLLFGLPCLFCGGTRSLHALSNLDMVSSFRFNPLVLLLFVASASSFLKWLIHGLFRRENVFSQRRFSSAIRIHWLLLTLLLANWIFLLFTLPGEFPPDL